MSSHNEYILMYVSYYYKYIFSYFFLNSNTDETNMQVSNKEIHVYSEDCASKVCKDNCGPEVSAMFCGL